MRLSLRLNLALICGVTSVSLAFVHFQVREAERGLRQELERNAVVLAESLARAALTHVNRRNFEALEELIRSLQIKERLVGIAVYGADGQLLARSDALRLSPSPEVVWKVLREGRESGEFLVHDGRAAHVFAVPMQRGLPIGGAVAIYHDAAYISAQTASLWRRGLVTVLVQTVLIVSVTLLILHWNLRRPLAHLARWLESLRSGAASEADAPREELLQPLRQEAQRLAASLNTARAAAEREARLRNSAQALWTEERLRLAMRAELSGSGLYVLSHREPYEHTRQGDRIEWRVPASGLVTALEPILRAGEGTWIATGTGSGDRLTVDDSGHVRVPPDQPQYTLRRVWLSEEENAGYYLGVANEGLWPLCHIAHERPVFRARDWEHYQAVNRRFADAAIEEMRDAASPMVLVQDYHFALVPRMIKDARPDARVTIFWHIPWPNPEAFGICPWGAELLHGLLGADLVGFQLQAYCNNFLHTVDRFLEARLDWESFAVERGGHATRVRAYPISVAFEDAGLPAARTPLYQRRAELLAAHGMEAPLLGVGVDRVDYTKGLPEKLLGIESFCERFPRYREQFSFVQIGAPSRIGIARYGELMTRLGEEAQRINQRFQTRRWRPIIFLPRHHSHDEILPYYQTADFCMVTALHDGMNLVAKEYAAARSDDQGVLILSRFAGASRELVDALQVNPYDVEELAGAIHRALEMSPEEKRARMVRMRTHVREHNIYRWAGSLLTDLAAVRVDDARTISPGRAPSRLRSVR